VFSTKVIGWVAIVAVVLFIVLLALQFAELSFYKTEPSVWLKP
jgi:hypothetical protein